jgi:type IV pilus assembly protein PilA
VGREMQKTLSEGTTLKKNGFSLIELLIVVAIILIIAAIAIPNLLRARMSANEASAVGSLRTINTAEVTFSSTYGIGFGPLASLGSPAAGACTAAATSACLIDSVLTAGKKSGYTIAVPTPAANGTPAAPQPVYETNALPTAPGQSGQRSFCSDQSGVIRADPNGSAAPGTCAGGGTYVPIQ